MRLDEFLTDGRVVACPVDEFAGYVVNVGLPGDWEPFESATGMRLWVCRSDLRSSMFCSNAVLTMHRIEASLMVYEVFGMLADQQLQSVSGGREVCRESFDATEGPGVTGLLVMQIDHGLGSISSVSQTRVISSRHETLIAQLTVTALDDSPVDRGSVWLTVQLGAGGEPASTGTLGHVPVERGGL